MRCIVCTCNLAANGLDGMEDVLKYHVMRVGVSTVPIPTVSTRHAVLIVGE